MTKKAAPRHKLTINWTEAERFLTLLHGTTETELRFISNNGKVVHMLGDLIGAAANPDQEALKGLRQLNEEGYNAYAVINRPDPAIAHSKIVDPNTKHGGIADSDIIHVNGIFVDIDRPEAFEGETLDLLQNAPLEPSAIIQSSTIEKLHAYWLLADCSPEMFLRLQLQLIAYFKGDRTCRNLSRIMRIPGFWHVKGQPIQTRIIDDPGHIYTVSEILEGFNFDPEYQLYTEAPAERPADWQPPEGITARVMAAARTVAAKVAATDEGRHRSILWFSMSLQENRIPQAEAEQLAAEFAAMLPPRGSEPIPAAEAVDALKWAYAKGAGSEPWTDRKQQTITVNNTDPDNPDDPPEQHEVTVARPPIDIRASGYAKTIEKTDKYGNIDTTYQQLTNWTFTPTHALDHPSGLTAERGILSINGQPQEATLPLDAWSGRRELLAHISSTGATIFTNSSADIAHIRQYITLETPDLPRVQGVETHGLHITPNGNVTLFENAIWHDQDRDPLWYAGSPVTSVKHKFQAPQPGTPAELTAAKTAIAGMKNLMTLSAGLGLLGYAAASPYYPRLLHHTQNKILMAYIEGEKEAGKSTYISLILRAFTGSEARTQNASHMSPYQFDMHVSNANSILAAIDEYKQGTNDRIDELIRSHHDMEIKTRGTGKAGILDKHIRNAPLIVSGEGFSNDSATRSRGFIAYPLKKDRGATPEFEAVRDAPLEAFAHHIHQAARTATDQQVDARWEASTELVNATIGTITSPRLRLALSVVTFGLTTLQQECDEVAFDQATITYVIRELAQNTLQGETEGKDNLEIWLEQLGSALAMIPDQQRQNYIVPAKSAEAVIIRVTPSIDLVQRIHSTRTAVQNSGMLLRLARGATYIEGGDTHYAAPDGRRRVRGIRLNFSDLPERVDAGLLEKFYDTELLRLTNPHSHLDPERAWN